SGADLGERIASCARASLAPELYNRIDEVLVYAPLTREEVREIARRLLLAVGRTLRAQRGIGLEFSAEVVDFLLDNGGFDPALGARPMKRSVARLIEAPLAEKILAGELSPGNVVLLEIDQGQLAVDVLGDGANARISAAE
ncbi:MAG TPA: ATP-dependent Clp protease ATP-binding subunit, partial [Polyangiaceae bacterium]|nr:ATP-dependent Clp protease ATP-binding subunit [Polyangiaceae bacterium]